MRRRKGERETNVDEAGLQVRSQFIAHFCGNSRKISKINHSKSPNKARSLHNKMRKANEDERV